MKILFYLSNYKKCIGVKFYLDGYLNENVFFTLHKYLHILF